MSFPNVADFPSFLIEEWFKHNQRSLPWRQDRSAYRVWLAEIMLQQTQAVTVVPYFERFTHRFANVQELAKASLDEVLALWAGLGYYSRARHLHQTARIVAWSLGGNFPDTYKELLQLPGVGPYTAGAVLAFAFHKPAAMLDGNVVRVLSRLFADKTPFHTPSGKKHFEGLSLSLACLSSQVADWQEGLIELGALICKPKNPVCSLCPLRFICKANQHGQVELFPTKSQKIARTNLYMACVILHQGQKIYLEKNTSENLLSGLYAPPYQLLQNNEQSHPTALHLLKKLGVAVKSQELPTVTVRRVLTHRHLTLHGFLVPYPKPIHRLNGWVDINALEGMAISTAVRTLLLKALSYL